MYACLVCTTTAILLKDDDIQDYLIFPHGVETTLGPQIYFDCALLLKSFEPK